MVYLLHFTRTYKHAGHYIGFTMSETVQERMERHRKGSGSKLIRVHVEAGGDFVLARTWDGDRRFERKLKKRGGAARICPICNPETAMRRANYERE